MSLNLEQLRAFCAVAEHKGFGKAADRLGVQKAAISKSVKKLEETLGVRLLERSTRTLRMTEAGKALFLQGKHLLDASEHLVDEVRSLKQQVTGELRVAATIDLGITLSRELIPKLHRRYPELKVSLVLSYELADLFSEDIDVALRIGSLKNSSLVALKVGEVKRGLFASPAYLTERGHPQKPQELLQHSLLGFKARHQDELFWTLSRQKQSHQIPVEGAFCAMNFQALCQAAAGGLGIASLPEEYLAESIRSAGLVKLLPQWSLPRAEIMAVYPSRALKPAKLEAFLEALKHSEVFGGAAAAQRDR